MQDEEVIAAWQAQFASAAGEDQRLSKSEFVALLGTKDAFLADRLFARFDHDGQGEIDQAEFIAALERLTTSSEAERLRFAFELHDADGSGGIDRQELADFMRANLRENGLRFAPRQIDDLVARFFHVSDTDKSGDISFEELCATFAYYPGLLTSLAVSPLAWLKPRQPAAAPSAQRRRVRRSLSNRLALTSFLALYVVANAWLCYAAAVRYAAAGPLIQVARGSAAIVYLNGAFIFVPMLRHLMTRLRRSRLGRMLPLDESVALHKLCGHVMLAAGLVHTLAHLLNNPAVLSTAAGRSGLVLLVLFAGMWLTALPFVRKGGHFRLFFLAHLAYLAWIALAIAHGPLFWAWLSIPVAAFALERAWRMKRSAQSVRVISGEILPSEVLALHIPRPPGFRHGAGGYMFLKCPLISAYEWHPFTISSAPEQEALSVHIRAVGSWTGALYRLVKNRPGEVSMLLDGPYGAPAEDIFSVKRAVLVGAGIGVTPFASVLRSILLRKRANDPTLQLEKVRFFWLSRDQQSFEWFLQLLSEIESEGSDLFELNVYLTGAVSRHDLKAATLFIAMDMLHEHTQVDLITGLQQKTHIGRPDWKTIFERIASEDGTEPSTVFFCGPPGLGRELKTLSRRSGLAFRQEAF